MGSLLARENVELKCELRDLERARELCREAGAAETAVLHQTDTYYRVPSGRLKRRETAGRPTEWVLYERADVDGARSSHYELLDDEAALERFGDPPGEVWAVVRKRRELWMRGDVRIHLDDVEGLGRYLELEALVTPHQDREQATAALEALRTVLSPSLGPVVRFSYSDLV